MAEARYRVYNSEGGLQFSENMFTMGLVSVGTKTLTDDGSSHPQPVVHGYIDVPDAINPVIAILPPARSTGGIMGTNTGISLTHVVKTGNNFRFWYRCTSSSPVTFQYWVFDAATKAMKDATMTNAGIRLRDSTGVLTFDAAMPAMRVVDFIQMPMPEDSSFPMGSHSMPKQTIVVPAGKKYAVIPGFFGMGATMWDAGNYGDSPGGGPIIRPDPGEPPISGSYTWKDMYLETSHTQVMQNTNGNLIVGLGLVESYYGWYPANTEQHLFYYGQIGFTIVDLSDYIEDTGGGSPGSLTVTINATSRSASGAPGTNVVTTAVTATPSGGTAPYTYQWQFVEGSTLVGIYGSTGTTNALRTETVSQAGGTSYVAVYRCRVQDSTGKVGFSPDVTFTHTTEAIDQTPNAMNWANISETTTSTNHRLRTSFLTLGGVNSPINLRATISNVSITGSPTSYRLECYTNGDTSTVAHHSTTLNNGAWTQSPAMTNGTIQWASYVTGTGSVSYTVTVTNVQTGAVIDTFTVNHTTGQLTYNVDAISWPNISNMSGTSSVSNNQPWRNITGNTGNVVLKATVSNVTRASTVTSSRLEIRINNSDTAHATTSGTNLANGSSCQTTGNMVGGSIRISVFAGGTGTISYTVTLTNVTTGAVVSTFTVSHGVNIEDKTPDAISYPGFNGTSNDPDAWFTGVPVTIKGINRDITIRVERYNYSGNMDACYVDVFTKATSATEWTHRGYFEAHQADYRYLDIVVSNNTDIRWDVHGVTNSGRRTATMDFCLWNLGVAPNVQLTRVNGNTFAVDNDNNYNIPDYVPNTITISNVSTTNNSQNVTVDRSFTVGGINREVTLRFNITNVSGNADTRNLLIYKNNVLQHTLAATANRNASVTVVNGDVIKLTHNASTTYRKKTANWTTTIYNLSSGTTQLVQYTVALSADNDDNYQRVTYTGGGNISVTSNDHMVYTDWRYVTVGGYTGNKVIRMTRSAVTNTGNQSGGNVMNIAVSPNGTDNWTYYTLNASSSRDFTIPAGHVLAYNQVLNSGGGKATTACTLTFRDQTHGANFYTASINVTADNDNNYIGTAPLTVSTPSPMYPTGYGGQGYRIPAEDSRTFTISGGVAPFTSSVEVTQSFGAAPTSFSTTPATGTSTSRTVHARIEGYANEGGSGAIRVKVVDANNTTAYSGNISVEWYINEEN